MNMFKKATRKQSRLKLSITGPSGSGKTMSALRIAAGIGGKVAVIDTENGSASLYANDFEFDVCELHPPYTVESYQKALDSAEQAGYDIIIIDSISHQWAGEGGLLEVKEQMDARGGANKFSNWGAITKKHESFKSSILHSTAHIITTMRSKQEYVLQDRDGKQVPKKVGLAPIQRDGLEYEFTVVFDVAMNHEAEASKDRTNLFTDKIFKITEETGRILRAWLESGEKTEAPVRRPTPPPSTESQQPRGNGDRKVTDAQIKRLFAIQKGTKWTETDVKFELQEKYGLDSTKDLTMADYDELIKTIQTSLPLSLNDKEDVPY